MSDKFEPYKYVKRPIEKNQPVMLKPKPKPSSGWLRIVPSVLISVGVLMLVNVAWPIVSYQLLIAPTIQKDVFVSPVPESELGNDQVTIPGSASENSLPTNPNAPQVLGADVDYTNPSTWFPTAGYSAKNEGSVYEIDIPSLDVENAIVEMGGDDLDKGLIQYPDTALPGQLGSPVIFGHSILRQFYNPDEDNPNRYVSIFSKIMTMKNGERIYVNFDGIRYTYEVKDKLEVKPDDLFILEQRYNNRELKLITCTPEGTYLRRGVVIAQLVNLQDVDELDESFENE